MNNVTIVVLGVRCRRVSTMSDTWIKLSDHLPAEDRLVMTKIDDTEGCRNEQPLRRKGRLWFSPDRRTYVYYTPTHWLPMAEESYGQSNRSYR
jgi:hypothetical protein